MPLQTFDRVTHPGQSAPRVARLRQNLTQRGLDAFLVPRADLHQGEYVADRDARLAWLTGFTGSAGFAAITRDRAGVFVDGRYRVQVKAETDPAIFTPVAWPETQLADWLIQALPEGGRIGFDPWLHTRQEISGLASRLEPAGLTLVPELANPIDAIWDDQPAAPKGQVRIHPDHLAGASAASKCAMIAAGLTADGHGAAVLTLPDSIAWLLNIRGTDLPHNPVVQACAIIEADSHVSLFIDPDKLDAAVRAHLADAVTLLPPSGFGPALAALTGPVRVDPATAPEQVFALLEVAGTAIAAKADPVILPKAIKNPAEIAGMRDAHLHDGVAMVRFLAWLDRQQPGTVSEIDAVTRLEGLRLGQGALDISFTTIAGAGPNGAMCHYRVSTETNRIAAPGELLLVDSGGQYPAGTTDITRTMAIGPVDAAVRAPYTRVLQGMIAISRARFPRGLAGRDLDALARAPLWMAGQDFDHGTGHGVGAALCVHEGPIRISRISEVPLVPGMILSNEPGYYREGGFGIRIENLIVVQQAQAEPGRDMLDFETLTFVPIDTRLIDTTLMSGPELDWLDGYHAETLSRLAPHLDGADLDWLQQATRPIARA